MHRLHLLLLACFAAPCAFSQTYTIQTFAGGALIASGGPAAGANPGAVFAVALDAKGDVFFTSGQSHQVLQVDARTGVLGVVAGNGTSGYSGDGGPAASAQLKGPVGVAVDASGNIYVADLNSFCVRRIAPNGIITTVAGTGISGFSGDGGPATLAQLSYPRGVAVDSTGNLFIADNGNNRIREVSNGIITTVAGGGPGAYSGDNGPATAAALYAPEGVAVSASGDIYIADTYNFRVRKVSNGIITTVAGNGMEVPGGAGDNGPAIAATLSPTGVALDSAGNLYIAELAERIREVSNGVITTVAGNGTAGFSGDNGPASAAELSLPSGVAVDNAGNLYIADADNDRVRKVANGVITTLAGNGLVGDGGPATSALLNAPYGVAIDASGNVYLSDFGNSRIRKISSGVITTVANVASPQGLAVDAASDIFVAGSDEFILEISNGATTTAAGGGAAVLPTTCVGGPALNNRLNNPEGVAVDSAGNIYIADWSDNCVKKDTGGTVNPFAGSGVGGVGSGDGGPALDASVPAPSGLAIDRAGNLFLTEPGSVRKVSNGVITAVAGQSDIGAGFSGDNGPATSAYLNGPEGVAVDASGNIYIADTYNQRIRKSSNGVITTIAGNGTAGFSGDGGAAAAAELNHPSGVAVDAAGNVYVVDQSNNRVRMLIPSGLSCAAASVTASTLSPPAAASTITANIQIGATCVWAVQNLPSWITFSGNALGTGPAVITLSVAANKGAARSAIISVAGADLAITQLAPTGFPAISANGIVPIYSTSTTVQAGSWVSIFGTNLAAGPALWNNDFPTSLGGVTVTFNGQPAYLWYVSPGQINLQVPNVTAIGLVPVVVMNSVGSSTSTVQLNTWAPSLSLFPGNRYSAAVILTPNGSGAYQGGSYDLAGPSGYFSFSTRPVKPGETLVLYGVGFGETNPTVPAGSTFSGSAPTVFPVTVTIGGVSAQVLYSGITSAGLYQINLVVPATAASGDQLLVAEVSNTPAQSGVYVTVQ